MRPVNPALSLRLPIGRARVLLALMVLAFLAVAARALYLQGVRTEFLQQEGESRYARVLELPAHRGVIADRNGEPLAISTAMESVWATPALAKIDRAQRARLATLLGVSEGELKQRLDSERDFVYLKRHLPPEVAERVVQMRLPGISLKREYRRYYPAGEVTGHLIGFTDLDDRGQEGVELAYQARLAGKAGSRRVIQDRLGRVVEDAEGRRPPVEGQDIHLSIDSRLQYMAYRELKAAVIKHAARAGGIVVLDVKTGELLALANLPTYNPNNRTTLTADSARNRVVTDLFEPGSTLKPFTVAAALEAHMVKPETTVQTSPGYLMVGSARISDAHPAGMLTVSQVIQRSSNVGVAKIALSLPKEQLWGVLSAVGFGVAPHVGFPGEAGGRLRDYQRWRPIEQATLAYGHGISVSLLQLARAYSIFATDGSLQPVTLLKHEEPASGVRVLSSGTAHAVRSMLETVVQPGGTAVRAQVPGYRVAGKTGTAHKLQGASYAGDRYVSSFVGMAPASDPRLIVAVMIDEPHKGEYYGGIVAAPVFSAVMAEALRMLRVAPDAPITPSMPVVGPAEAKEEV
ncbi:MAG TPA: penicillin-binding protein 2 [Burkholderiales bacterium]|nr:penicillin-binding protein 2 [Burkholderiales bacterium]